MKSNTIAAIATPMTNSGIGIIRISGDEALDIIEKVFKPKKKDKKIKDVKTYTAHYGHVYDESTLLDECIVLVMKGPHSYTAEDVVEINCHGGVVVMKKVLESSDKSRVVITREEGCKNADHAKRAKIGIARSSEPSR